MTDLSFLHNRPLFYISPDIRRALGLELILPNYYIICSFYEPLVNLVRKKGAHVFCLEEELSQLAGDIKNSGQLLENNLVQQFIKEKSGTNQPNLIYFKPSLKLDLLCKQNGYQPLVNSYNLNEQFENKINFFNLTKQYFTQYHIQGEIESLIKSDFKELEHKLGVPFVVQFGHGWAGKTTFIVNDENSFLSLKKRFPGTKVKIVKYIRGFTVLNNCCLYQDQVLVGDLALQLNNIKGLSTNPSVTCGRQWPSSGLTCKQMEIINDISQKLGQLMAKQGYQGFFGLDFLIEDKTGKVYLSENNARFTASTPFYTKIELHADKIPLMAYHLAAFLNLNLKIIKNDKEIVGSQIIIRNNSSQKIAMKDDLKAGIYKLIKNHLEFVIEGYEVNKLNIGEFIIVPERRGKIIEEDEEIARIEIKKAVLNGNYQLIDDIKKIVDIIKNQLTI